jgi:rhamnosyltransferase subunit B
VPVKIIVMPIGSSGDVHPLLGLALELKRRGHEIVFATNGHFEPLARKAGLAFEALGTDAEYRRAISDPDIWHPTRGTKKVLQWSMVGLLRQSYAIVEKHYQPGETIVISAALGLGARVAHDKLGVPLVTVQLQPLALHSRIKPARFPAVPGWMPVPMVNLMVWLGTKLLIDPTILPPLNEFRRELGLLPLKGNIFSEYINSPQLVLGLFPEWFAPPPLDWPRQLRLTGFPLYDEKGLTVLEPALDEFINAGDSPIAFTPGSAMLQGRPFFSAAAEACRMTGRRGLLLTRFPENIPPVLPDGVKHFSYAPFSEILPRCAALVHHGGIGTMAQALAAGIPQLIMPMAHDQFDNGARIEQLKVGMTIPRGKFTAGNVAGMLRRLLDDPACTQRAQAIARNFENARPIETACDVIEDFARQIGTQKSPALA